MSYPLVAVVTPVLNGAKYLAETMESVQSLDYPNLVHVVLDNASTDSTPEIIESYRDRRVPLITKRGTRTVPMAANWNAAVRMTPPEAGYFRILCADDSLCADAIIRPVEIALRDPEVGIVGCLWRADGLCGEELPEDREIFDGKEVIRSYLRREHAALSGMHVLVRRTQLQAEHPFYDETLASFDSDANLRICMKSKYGFVRRELGTWRVHPSSITSRIATKTFAHETCWLTLLDRYGPQVLGFRAYMECRKAYRHQLLRRLLKARFLEGSTEAFANRLERMRLAGDPVRPLDFAEALADWAHLALMRQRHRVGMPRRGIASQYGTGAMAQVPEF